MSGYKNYNTISLENFDPTNTKEPILTSPRSLEACKRQGIDPSELTVKTLADIKEMYEDTDLDKEGFEMMVEHVEKKRVQKVKLLLQERERLADELREGRSSLSKLGFGITKRNNSAATSPKNKKLTLQTILNTKTDSTMIEREKKQLEKIQMRQEKEIKHMIEYEAKMTEVKKSQEEKLAKEKERERRMEMERLKQQKESEERKRLREIEELQREEEEEEERKRMAAEAYKKEQEFLAIEKEKERKRQLEAKKREEEQRIRHEEFLKKTEEKLLEQKILVEKKKEEMEAKDRIRKEFLEQQALLKQKESEEKRKLHEEKLKGAKDKFEEVLLLKKIEFDQKQKKNEERRKLFEAEIERKKEEAKKKAEIHEMNLQRVFEENKKIEEEKKRYLIMRAEMAEERRKELEVLAEQDRQRKIQEEREREEKRKQIKVNMEIMSKEKVETIMHSIEEAEERLAKAQKEKEKEMQLRKNLDIINKLDKLENVQRMTKVKAYEKQRLEDKLDEAYEKANKIKQDREEILEVRKVIRKEMEVSKKILADKFEKVKLGKLNPLEFAAEIKKTMPKKNGSSGLAKIFTPPKSLNTLPDKPSTMVFFTPQVKKKAESLANLDATHDLSQRVLPSVQSLPYLQNNKRKPKNIKITTTKPAAVNGATVNKGQMIEKLKLKQNEEMLVLLEEERERECIREAEMENEVDSARRRHLEEDFKVERGIACSRIEQLANNHEVALRQTMMRYNVLGEKGN